MDFVAIDFETTGYAGDASNDPWQLGVAVVQGGEIVEMREFFFWHGAHAGRRADDGAVERLVSAACGSASGGA
jgi:hypothetical protein